MLNREPGVPPFNTVWKYSPVWWARLRNQMGYKLLNRVGQPIREVIFEYRQRWNLPKYIHPNDAYSQLAQLSQAPAEFEFPREQLPQWFHFTGSYHSSASREPVPFPDEKLTGKPLIYASMGTLQNRLTGVFQKIASASVGLDAQLVISLGGSASPESLPELPGNPLVVKYAPQLELLQKATLMITHAPNEYNYGMLEEWRTNGSNSSYQRSTRSSSTDCLDWCWGICTAVRFECPQTTNSYSTSNDRRFL